MPSPALYDGLVTHVRVSPVHHRLTYRVFSLLLDCTDLDAAGKSARLFSIDRFNLVSFHQKDHGDGGPLLAYLQRIAAEAGLGDDIARFDILAYPRILGYVFNPLTTYYGYDRSGQIALMIYEVRNTFKERMTYVVPAAAHSAKGDLRQSCPKRFYVSPFNRVEGDYRFNISPPGDRLRLGIALDIDDKTVLTATFKAERHPLTDKSLLKALTATGWMSVKVIAGIHYEALKLWLKGLRLNPRPPAPKPDHAFSENPPEKRPADAA